MQEAGVPVTFGYISDAHDNHKNAFPAPADPTGQFPRASGPGESDYVAALKSYDDAFATFFKRLGRDGINQHNTLFVVTADENDHFAGGVSNDGNWSHTFCNLDTGSTCPANQIGEVNANLRALLPSPATQPLFSVHSDSAPTVYVNGNPEPASPTLRQLERDVAGAQALDPYISTAKQPITLYLADKVGEKALHMVTADPQRTPSFTLFANPDYFLTAGVSGGTAPTKFNCPDAAHQAFTCIDYHFAWNHGDATDDIGRTWLGMAGPGIRELGQTSSVWTDHTDIQPTMLALAGLSDDYGPDGRVITEFVRGHALPHALRWNRGSLTELGTVYKEINAPFGPLSYDVLRASTQALSSGSSSDDSTYTSVSNRIASLTSDRDALAAQMRDVLNHAAFGGPQATASQVETLIEWGNSLLMRANQLGVASSP
jgi:arylsulfatase A-like enzyme